jgi:hypothetical protein
MEPRPGWRWTNEHRKALIRDPRECPARAGFVFQRVGWEWFVSFRDEGECGPPLRGGSVETMEQAMYLAELFVLAPALTLPRRWYG